jgi:hypothetical protein
MRPFLATMVMLAVTAAAAAHAQVRLVNDGMEEMCKDAARDRGWRVRDTGKALKSGERGMIMSMRVRDGGRTFDAICRAEDDNVSVQRRD